MEFSVEQIAALIGGKIEGDPKQNIKTISGIEDAGPQSIAFLSNPKYESFLYSTRATAVIVNKDLILEKSIEPSLIRVDDPYSSFTLLLEEYQRMISMQNEGIDKLTSIGKDFKSGEQCYVGAFVAIGNNVTIGNNVKIYPNTTIGDNTTIDDNTVIHSGVSIYSNIQIGRHCVIHSGAVIGSDGFGFAPQSDGSYKSIPQVGNVIIKDHVSVGANTVIDCATFDSTIIEEGVKLDNLIQVAHNVEIGQHTVIAAQAGISGSTKIGKQCIIGGQAGLVGHIHIADETKIQAQSGVTKNTKKGNAIYGSPALDYNNYIRSYAVFKRLPETLERIKQLEEKILTLPATKKD